MIELLVCLYFQSPLKIVLRLLMFSILLKLMCRPFSFDFMLKSLSMVRTSEVFLASTTTASACLKRFMFYPRLYLSLAIPENFFQHKIE